MSGPRVCVLDIETSPALADVWGLWDQNVGLNQLRQVSRMICFAAKWHGDKRVEFYSEHHDGTDEMLKQAHRLLDECDVLVHFNGKKFDTPHLRREFLLAGLTPPSPFKEVDLCQIVKQRFRFMSNKLDHVADQLGVGTKVRHTGHQLWVDCLAGDPKAWALMKKYNIGDVRITEAVYDKLVPWIESGPHMGLYRDDVETPVCSRCGSENVQRRGVAHTQLSVYPRWHCQACGSWSRGARRIGGVDLRGVR